MSLTPEQISALLAKPERARSGGRTTTGKRVDTSTRDHKTWFLLAQRIVEVSDEPEQNCENPNCQDPRPNSKTKIIAEVDGVHMCRYCFLSGYMLVNPDQVTIDNGE